MTQRRTRHRSTTFILPLALTALACSSTAGKSAVGAEPTFDPELLPALAIAPATWETCGDTRQISIRIDEPAAEPLSFEFEYVGEGDVDVPERATISAGETQAVIEGEFMAEPTASASEGRVKIKLVDQRDNAYTVREWPVLHRPSIITAIDVKRLPMSRSAEQYYSCLVAVELDGYEQELASPPSERDFEVTATVEQQGPFNPDVTVVENVARGSITVLPDGFFWDDDKPVMMVEVAKPKFPPMKRAYLEITVSYGGDVAKKAVPLPTR